MTPSILGWMCIRQDLGGRSGFARESGDGGYCRNESGDDSPVYSRPARQFVDRSDADAQSFPDQATTLGLLWLGAEDVHQWGISLRRWATETLQEGPGRPRAQHQP